MTDKVALRAAFKRRLMERLYHGISYPMVLGRLRRLWRRLCCPRGWHLLDEVVSSGGKETTFDHYLYCDACGLTVWIERIADD